MNQDFNYDKERDGALFLDLSDEQIAIKDNALKGIKKLWAQKKYDKLIKVAEEAMKKLPEKASGNGDTEISEMYLLYASALREIRSMKKEKVKKYALISANFDRQSKGAMWLIRELNNKYKEEAKLFSIQVTGKFFAPTKKEGVKLYPFKTIYRVVAGSEKEAMHYIKEFERQEIKESLKLFEAIEEKKSPETPLGVYSTMRLIIYEEKKENPENN